jgi:RNA-binding protein YlmH
MHAQGQAYLILADDELKPDYLTADLPELAIKTSFNLPDAPAFECIYFSAGKKDKISKGDIAGLLVKKGGLKFDEIGLISITDKASYVAVKRNKVDSLLTNLFGEKLKKAKVKAEIAN